MAYRECWQRLRYQLGLSTGYGAMLSAISHAHPVCIDREPGQLQTSRFEARVLRGSGACCTCAARERLVLVVGLSLAQWLTRPLDISIEQVAALSSQNTLPEPSLDLDRLQTSTSTFVHPQPPPPMRGYTVDPWSVSRPSTIPAPSTYSQGIGSAPSGTASSGVGSTIVAGTGLPDYWWQKQEKVKVSLLGHQGFILNRYVVYEIITEVRPFSNFWIHDRRIDVCSRGKNDPLSDGIQSLLSCGIACCGGILSAYFLRYHLSALEVGQNKPLRTGVDSCI